MSTVIAITTEAVFLFAAPSASGLLLDAFGMRD